MATGLGAAVAELLAEQLSTPMRFAGSVPLVRPLLATCCFHTLAWTLKVLPLASGSFCSRSHMREIQRQRRRSVARVGVTTARPQVSAVCGRRLQVISTRYLLRVDTGFLV